MFLGIQTFGECLTAWMEEKGLTPAELSAFTHETRDATIARLMHDQLDYQRCARYITELAEHFPDIDEETLKRFRIAVDVSRYGKEMYLAKQNFFRMILEGKNDHEQNPSKADEFCQELLEWSEGMDFQLLCVGLTDSEPVKFLNLISKKRENIRIYHFFDYRHVETLSGLLAETLSIAFHPNYELYEIRDALEISLNNIMIARREDGAHQVMVYDGVVFSSLNIPKGAEVFDFSRNLLLAKHRNPRQINRRFTHNSHEAYLEFLSHCLSLEKNTAIYHIKSEIGLEYVPTDILVRNFSEWANLYDPSFLPYIEKMTDIFSKRYENILKKTEPTYLIMTKEGMTQFVKTGRMKDHPFCLRSFTKEERKIILQSLLDAAADSTSLTPLIFASDTMLPNHSLIGYGRECMLVCAAGANYNLSNYTEIVLASSDLSGQFADFVTGILIKSHVLSKKSGLEFIQSLIRMVDET